MFFVKPELKSPSLVSTTKLSQSAFISARLVTLSFSEAKLSFTQDVAGPLFTLQPKQMLWFCWKIDH
jgi:hypothetical protein